MPNAARSDVLREVGGPPRPGRTRRARASPGRRRRPRGGSRARVSSSDASEAPGLAAAPLAAALDGAGAAGPTDGGRRGRGGGLEAAAAPTAVEDRRPRATSASGHDAGGAAGRRAPHASSRRRTGKRSSGAATTNPSRSQNAGGRRWSRPPWPRPPGTSRPPRTRAPRGRRRRPRRASPRGPAGRAARRRRDARDDRRQRRVRQPRVQLAGAEGARVGGQRPELRVGRRLVVAQQHLGVARRRPSRPRPSSRSLGRARTARDAGRCLGRGANGLIDRLVVVVGERVERRLAAAPGRTG